MHFGITPTILSKGGTTLKVPVSYSYPLRGEGLENQIWTGVVFSFR